MSLKVLFICFIFTTLCACSTQKEIRIYDGPLLGEEFESTLILPINFNLFCLDKQDISSFRQSFRNHDLHISIPAGPHTLTLEYDDFWQIDDENHSRLSSGKLIFSINMKAQSVYKLLTPKLETYDQAQNFVSKPMVYLVSDTEKIKASHIPKIKNLTFKTKSEHERPLLPKLQQLKFWWLQASAHEKSLFLTWQTALKEDSSN